jgi:hypothetical protein
MADLFSTNVVNGVVASLLAPPSFFLDTFFPNVQTETTEEIHFDTMVKTRRLAPFVSPLVEGKVVATQGFKTNTFKPAYIKDKRVWDGNRALKRSPGEQIGGSLSPMQRMQAILGMELQDQLEILTRRQEWMASQVLVTGAVTVVGDNYPSVSVNFGRDSSLTVVKTGGTLWTDAGVNPLKDLQTWALSVLKLSGAMPDRAVMEVNAWEAFRENPFVIQRLNTQRTLGQAPSMAQSAATGEGGVFMGTVDGFNIYVYSGWYLDDSGTEQPMLPSGTVILGGPQIMGYKAYGAIRDEESGYQALPYFVKSWIQKDPAVRFILMQSAPLVVPYRPNAQLAATVL